MVGFFISIFLLLSIFINKRNFVEYSIDRVCLSIVSLSPAKWKNNRKNQITSYYLQTLRRNIKSSLVLAKLKVLTSTDSKFSTGMCPKIRGLVRRIVTHHCRRLPSHCPLRGTQSQTSGNCTMSVTLCLDVNSL